MILLPCFCIIIRVSQLLFPGRVGILTLLEVVVAMISASILLPDEPMVWIKWIGALSILFAGLIKILFRYQQRRAPEATL